MKIIYTKFKPYILGLLIIINQVHASENNANVKVKVSEISGYAKIKIERVHGYPKEIQTIYIHVELADLAKIRKFISDESKVIKVDKVIDPKFPVKDGISLEKLKGSLYFKYGYKDHKNIDVEFNSAEINLLIIELDKHLAKK